MKFFLNLDDRFGALELLLQAFDLLAELGVFECERIGFDAALFRGESIQDPLSPLAPPGGEMRGVQSFSPHQGTPFGRGGAGIRFIQDAFLVLGSELAMPGFGPDLWVR